LHLRYCTVACYTNSLSPSYDSIVKKYFRRLVFGMTKIRILEQRKGLAFRV